jgi:hypothetical protein
LNGVLELNNKKVEDIMTPMKVSAGGAGFLFFFCWSPLFESVCLFFCFVSLALVVSLGNRDADVVVGRRVA